MTASVASMTTGKTMEEEMYSQLPMSFSYPFYFRQTISMLPFVSDKYLSLLLPIAIYWAASLWYLFLDTSRFAFFEKFRLHEPQEVQKRNRVGAKKVILMVFVQQIFQTMVGLLVLEGEEVSRLEIFQDHKVNVDAIGVKVAKMAINVAGLSNGVKLMHLMGPNIANWIYWWGIPLVQFMWAFFVMDAWQYFMHRAFHESRFLYKHFHSHHHRLYVPYAFGALYNHPLEGLLLDSAGGALSHACALMTVRQGILLFASSTFKTVSDHGGYAFPMWLDPLHLLFPNTSEYHDVHHQMQGLKFNYSQPFFVHFDVVFGTRMSAEKFQKMREVNKKFKLSSGAAQIKRDIAENEEKSDNTNADLRMRNNSEKEDQSPEEIVLQADGGDPTVTLNAENYKAKAGTTT
ncbi:hypothetical protein CBS101457_006017 [Exobasidium rhododendri]|nr:hypothetical protein CBS101457_006017 [Exobasidium rhododendri]